MRELVALEEKHPELAAPDSPARRVGGEPAEGFAAVDARRRRCCRSRTPTPGRRRRRGSPARGASLGGAEPARLRRRAEDRRPLDLAALRGRRARSRRDARRRVARRGRHGERRARSASIPLRDRRDARRSRCAARSSTPRRRSSGSTPSARRRASRSSPIRATPPRARCGCSTRGSPRAAGSTRGSTRSPKRRSSRRRRRRRLERLRDWGFPVNPHWRRCGAFEEVRAFLDEWGTKRHGPRVRDRRRRGQGGRPARSRRGSERRRSRRGGRSRTSTRRRRRRRSCGTSRVQVGRTGTLTPVAHLDPVVLGGTTVKRATLHNYEDLARKDVRVGDTVVVEKGGDVIPKVVRVLLEQRPRGRASRSRCPSAAPSAAIRSCGRRARSRRAASTRPARPSCGRRCGTSARGARWTSRGWARSSSISSSRRDC